MLEYTSTTPLREGPHYADGIRETFRWILDAARARSSDSDSADSVFGFPASVILREPETVWRWDASEGKWIVDVED